MYYVGYFRRCNIDIEELSNKIDKYHEDGEKRAKKDKYANVSYIAGGFTLAALGLAVSNLNITRLPELIGVILMFLAATIFFTISIYSYKQSQKIKVD